MPKEHAWLVLFREDARVAQNSLCYYCESLMTRDDCTADHLIPKSKGGRTVRENIVAACKLCNSFKGSHSEEEFRKFLEKQKIVVKNTKTLNYRKYISHRLSRFKTTSHFSGFFEQEKIRFSLISLQLDKTL